jgi:hypothetical protein
MTIAQWAYESTPDCAIAVGQTSGDNCPTGDPDPADVPEPNATGLALLALGAAGVKRWRDSKTARQG